MLCNIITSINSNINTNMIFVLTMRFLNMFHNYTPLFFLFYHVKDIHIYFHWDIHMYRIEYIRNSSLQITKGKCSSMYVLIHQTPHLAVEKFESGNKYCLLISANLWSTSTILIINGLISFFYNTTLSLDQMYTFF